MGKVSAAAAERRPRSKAKSTGSAVLEVELRGPGMTPMLRAGVGGLAASLRAILREADAAATWPSPIRYEGAEINVTANAVKLEFNDADPGAVLKWLFERSFRVRDGIIHLPGAFGPMTATNVTLRAALQAGLKRTFLQHGKSTTKDGASVVRETTDDDGVPVRVSVQPYASFAHQSAFEDVLDAMRSGSVSLAGWAYPGNAGRHNAFKADTDWRYSSAEALAGIFSIVGCVSYAVPRSGGAGALVIVEPSDLIAFAETRQQLTPRSLKDASLTGTGDAVLAIHLALRAEEAAHESGVAAVHGVTLRATPWATQQKSRVATMSLAAARPEHLRLYDRIAHTLRAKLVTSKLAEDGDEGTDESSFFIATSALRAFATDNIARGRPWFAGFATATTGGKTPRFIHYYRSADKKSLGALYPDEREGLIAMVENLEGAELALVRSVHQALRQRLGAIADETKNLPEATRKNRFRGERDKWRLAFFGAKTPEQVRASLADLWSRAGTNPVLQENWELVVPLLRAAHWQTARDLALVALASYAKAGSKELADDEVGDDGDKEGDE